MVEVANPAGRLITFRVRSPVEDGNAERAAVELRRAVQSVAGQVVVCTDLTDARTFAPATVERFVEVMKADNPRLERSAILLGTNSATFVLQIERIVREANSPVRHTFREARPLVEWLRPSLTPDEEAALVGFLAAL
jgi:hypothetical protein